MSTCPTCAGKTIRPWKGPADSAWVVAPALLLVMIEEDNEEPAVATGRSGTNLRAGGGGNVTAEADAGIEAPEIADAHHCAAAAAAELQPRAVAAATAAVRRPEHRQHGRQRRSSGGFPSPACFPQPGPAARTTRVTTRVIGTGHVRFSTAANMSMGPVYNPAPRHHAEHAQHPTMQHFQCPPPGVTIGHKK